MAKMKYGSSGGGFSTRRGTVNEDYSPGRVKGSSQKGESVGKRKAREFFGTYHTLDNENLNRPVKQKPLREYINGYKVVEGPPKTDPFPKKKTGRPTTTAQRRAKVNNEEVKKQKQLRMKLRAEAISFSKDVVKTLVKEFSVDKENADNAVFEKEHLPGKYMRNKNKYLELGVNGAAEIIYQKRIAIDNGIKSIDTQNSI